MNESMNQVHNKVVFTNTLRVHLSQIPTGNHYIEIRVLNKICLKSKPKIQDISATHEAVTWE